MEIRVITLRYTEGAQGFPEEALRRATAGREVLETSEHFFVYGNVPHLTLVLKLGGEATGATGWREKSNGAPDLELELPDSRKGVFRAIKKWRNEKAKSEGKPAYAIMRNVQVLEIVKAMPQSLAGLKEIDGIGEATAEAYGKEILEILSNAPPEVSPDTPVDATVEGEKIL